MSGELKDALKMRLDENYAAFMESLQEKTVSELIAMAPEITAAQQLHEELLDACDEDDVAFLLRFDDPLEVVRGYWESEISGYDHSGEMGHMLWEIRDRELYEKEQLAPEEVLPRPKMRLSEKEHRLVLIAGQASNILHGVGRHQQAGEVFQRVMAATDHKSALGVIEKYVDVEIIPAIKINKAAKRRKPQNER